MATGQFLRTNYRRTGREINIDTLGKAFLLASGHGGAGTLKPGGGIIYTSMSGSFADAGASLSNCFAWSTIELLQSYYGDGIYGSGYRFLPVIVQIQSYSDTSAGVGAGGASNAISRFHCINIGTSDSVFWFSGVQVSATPTVSAMGSADARIIVFGFIVSGP